MVCCSWIVASCSRSEKMTAYEWHGERVNVIAFTIVGGSDFDGTGIQGTDRKSQTIIASGDATK